MKDPMMYEKTQTRTEHSRSLDDAERFKAIDTLREVGLFVPMRYIDVYHGRAGHADEQGWAVDPYVKNGHNDNDNMNVNHRPTLYTAMSPVAAAFARIRTTQHRQRRSDAAFQEEIHRIVSADMDAMVIDARFSTSSLDQQRQDEYYDALRTLSIPITEGSPLPFDARDAVFESYRSDRLRHDGVKGAANWHEAEDIARRTGHQSVHIDRLAGAENMRRVLLRDPVEAAEQLLLHEATSHPVVDMYGYPVNIEYAERWMKQAHVVGLSQRVHSGTLRKWVNMVTFFDLTNVQSESALQKERTLRARQFGEIGLLLGSTTREAHARTAHHVMNVLATAYAKPEAVIAAARRVSGFQNRFDQSVGVWEGFTLGEHTETVLRNFEESYADKVPVNLLLPMRLAMTVHDIGKPIAHASGSRSNQAMYNIQEAKDFLMKIGADKPLQTIVLGMIGEGVALAHRVNVNKSERAAAELTRFSREVVEGAYGRNAVTQETVDGFSAMCHILQVCDGGAYTSMAVTRKDGSGIQHRNHPSFDTSFRPPAGLGGRHIAPR